ncbi:unnamed protein product [Pedinophyceae sp. YPF-701]|nr:unnamed protein product [Pedinophyceae sp. YPF-701]
MVRSHRAVTRRAARSKPVRPSVRTAGMIETAARRLRRYDDHGGALAGDTSRSGGETKGAARPRGSSAASFGGGRERLLLRVVICVGNFEIWTAQTAAVRMC